LSQLGKKQAGISGNQNQNLNLILNWRRINYSLGLEQFLEQSHINFGPVLPLSL
jgi:hypothetical protein